MAKLHTVAKAAVLLGVSFAVTCAPVDLNFGDGGASTGHDGGFSDGGETQLDGGDAGVDAGACGHCAGLPLQCETQSGRCVECLTDMECGAARPACEPGTYRCVECVTSQHCEAGLVCEPITHRCAKPCQTFAECGPSYDDCANGICRLCDGAAECIGNQAGPRCDSAVGRCGQCTSSSQCPTATPQCDRSRGVCAGCSSSFDCPAGELCHPATKSCVPSG